MMCHVHECWYRSRRKGRVGHPSVSVRVEDEQIQLITNEEEDDDDTEQQPTTRKTGKGGMCVSLSRDVPGGPVTLF